MAHEERPSGKYTPVCAEAFVAETHGSVLYWYAYLCEEAVGGTYTVAPGCAAAMNPASGNRCSLTQFLQYLWAPEPDSSQTEADRPTTAIPANKKDGPWDRMTVNQVYNKIVNTPYTEYVDPERLIGESDYYEALSKVGTPIATVEKGLTEPTEPDRSSYPNDDDYKAAMKQYRNALKAYDKTTRLVALGKEAAKTVYYLRFQDMESYRIKNGELAKDRYLGVVPKTRTVQTGLNNPKDFQALDDQETLKAYSSDPDFETKFQEACRKYRTDDYLHFKALAAAGDALKGCGCQVPPIDGL